MQVASAAPRAHFPSHVVSSEPIIFVSASSGTFPHLVFPHLSPRSALLPPRARLSCSAAAGEHRVRTAGARSKSWPSGAVIIVIRVKVMKEIVALRGPVIVVVATHSSCVGGGWHHPHTAAAVCGQLCVMVATPQHHSSYVLTTPLSREPAAPFSTAPDAHSRANADRRGPGPRR